MQHSLDRLLVVTQVEPSGDGAHAFAWAVERLLRLEPHDAIGRLRGGEAKDSLVDVAPDREGGGNVKAARAVGQRRVEVLRHRRGSRHRVTDQVHVTGVRIGARQTLEGGRIIARFGRLFHGRAGRKPLEKNVEDVTARPLAAFAKPGARSGNVFRRLAAKVILRERAHEPRTAMGEAALAPIRRQRCFQFADRAEAKELEFRQPGEFRVLANHADDDRAERARGGEH